MNDLYLLQLSVTDNSLVRMEEVSALQHLVSLNLQNNSISEINGETHPLDVVIAIPLSLLLYMYTRTCAYNYIITAGWLLIVLSQFASLTCELMGWRLLTLYVASVIDLTTMCTWLFDICRTGEVGSFGMAVSSWQWHQGEFHSVYPCVSCDCIALHIVYSQWKDWIPMSS